MALRLLRDGILASDRVDRLSADAEVFYRRLMSVVDDYGRFDGRLPMLASACYPLRVGDPARARRLRISDWLKECVAASLVRCYEVCGKPYIELLDFGQRERGKPKFPAPPATVSDSPSTARDSPQPAAFSGLVEDVVVDVDKAEGGDDKRARGAHPAWLPQVEWAEWRKHRGRKLTPEAAKRQIAKLEQLRAEGHDPAAIIGLAIEKGWATFYPPKGERPQSGLSTVGQQTAQNLARWVENEERKDAERAAK